MNFGIDRSMQQFPARVAAPSPITLTTRELIEEAEELAKRISHSKLLPARDVALVQQLAARLGSKA